MEKVYRRRRIDYIRWHILCRSHACQLQLQLQLQLNETSNLSQGSTNNPSPTVV